MIIFLSALHSHTRPVQGQNRVFPVYFSRTGKNLFSLQGSQVMKNRVFPVRNSAEGELCFNYRDGFAA